VSAVWSVIGSIWPIRLLLFLHGLCNGPGQLLLLREAYLLDLLQQLGLDLQNNINIGANTDTATDTASDTGAGLLVCL
jgi:hypothetical protein